MSDKKKSLLTESEVRRFMALANIPAVGKINETMHVTQMDKGARQEEAEKYPQEEAYGQMEETYPTMGEEDETPGEEMVDVGDMAGDEMGGDDKEAKFEQIVMQLAELVGVDPPAPV